MGLTTADRTEFRNHDIAAAGQVFRNLRDDHVRLIDRNGISLAQLHGLHDADVVDAGTAHRGSLQLHRIKNCHRIDKPGS